MSAYMVDRGHVAYLVEAALEWAGPRGLSFYDETLQRHEYTRETAAALGQMLWNANGKSIEARYPDTISTWPEGAPGPIGETYRYGEHRVPDSGRYSIARGLVPCHEFQPQVVFSALSCFEYQACECDGWRTSEARGFCDRLRQLAIDALPECAEAEWGAPKLWVEGLRLEVNPC